MGYKLLDNFILAPGDTTVEKELNKLLICVRFIQVLFRREYEFLIIQLCNNLDANMKET